MHTRMQNRTKCQRTSRKPRDISLAEQKKILRTIIRLNAQAGDKNPENLIAHTRAVNSFARALARRMIANGANLDFQSISRATLMHDVARVRAKTKVDFVQGGTKPSSIVDGSEEKTASDHSPHYHERVAKLFYLHSGTPELRKAAKLLSARKWAKYSNPKVREHVTLEQLIVDLADAVASGGKVVPFETRVRALREKMAGFNDKERDYLMKAFSELRKLVKEKIEKKYNVSIDEIIARFQKKTFS